MGARRRKLNRELLGIDRADERDDEESFLGSQGSRLLRFLLLMSSSSLSLHASSHSVTAFVYSHKWILFSLSVRTGTSKSKTDDHKRRKRQRERYIETRKATSEAFVAICAVAAVIFGLVLWAHTHHL